MGQVFNLHFVDGTVQLSEQRLEEYAEAIGLSRVAPGRYTCAFVAKLYAWERANGIWSGEIVREIERLEGIGRDTGTKPATAFTREPLAGLWHQHFFTARFIPGNLIASKTVLEELVDKHFGHGRPISEDDIRALTDELVVGRFEQRFDDERLTGEWIVFAKHEGKNYYLTLSVHTTGTEQDQKLYDEIKLLSVQQFPFLGL